jgi:hypothetical protein
MVRDSAGLGKRKPVIAPAKCNEGGQSRPRCELKAQISRRSPP